MDESKDELVESVADETLRISVDGDWSLREVQEYLRVMQQLHGVTQVGLKLREENASVSLFSKHPWLGGYSHVNFYRWGVSNARKGGKELHLKKFQYNSPGVMEFVESAMDAGGVPAQISSWGVALYVVSKAVGTFVESGCKAVQSIREVSRTLKDEELTKKERHADLTLKEIAILEGLDELLTSDAPIPLDMEAAVEAATRGDLLHRVKARLSIRRRLRALGKYAEDGRALPQPEQMKPREGPRSTG